jgi:hypothetical protein
MKEIKDLQKAYTGVINDKRELEVKNKKYQEFLSTVLKEKEEKDTKIFELSKELEKMKKNLNEKDKKILDSDKKIRELELKIKENKLSQNQNKSLQQNNKSKDASVRRRIFFDDTEVRTSTRKYFTGNSSEKRNNRSNKPSAASTINVDLSSKIPIVTAFLHGGNIYSHTSGNVNSLSYGNIHSVSNSNNPIINLKNNLNNKIKRSFSKSPRTKNSDFEKIGEYNSNLSLKQVGVQKNNLIKIYNNATSGLIGPISSKMGFKNSNNNLGNNFNLNSNNLQLQNINTLNQNLKEEKNLLLKDLNVGKDREKIKDANNQLNYNITPVNNLVSASPNINKMKNLKFKNNILNQNNKKETKNKHFGNKINLPNRMNSLKIF